MSAVDFGAWAIPGLTLELGGRSYVGRPPSVADGRKLLAAAVRAEVNLGLEEGPIPDDVLEVLATIGPDDHPALGADLHAQLVADGIPQTTIDRMAYYAVFYWARGKAYADRLASILWTPRDLPDGDEQPEDGGVAPKSL